MIGLNDDKKKIHFIGIAGISMSAIARHMKNKGYIVSGSDLSMQESCSLKDYGIQVYSSHDRENIKDCVAVVYSSAISNDNEEYLQAKENAVPLIKRSVLLGQIISEYKNSIGICGSHGKTTITAMISNIL